MSKRLFVALTALALASAAVDGLAHSDRHRDRHYVPTHRVVHVPPPHYAVRYAPPRYGHDRYHHGGGYDRHHRHHHGCRHGHHGHEPYGVAFGVSSWDYWLDLRIGY